MEDIFEKIKSEIVPTHPDIYKAVTEQLIFNSAKDKSNDVSTDEPGKGFFDNLVSEKSDAVSGILKDAAMEKIGGLTDLMDTSKWGDDGGKSAEIGKDFFNLESLDKEKGILK